MWHKISNNMSMKYYSLNTFIGFNLTLEINSENVPPPVTPTPKIVEE